MTTLSERVRTAIRHASARRGTDVTLAELARACGIRGPSVSNWLSGKTKGLSAETALSAAEFLGVSPNWLATGDGPMLLDGTPDAAANAPIHAQPPRLTPAATPSLSSSRQADLADLLRDMLALAPSLSDAEFAQLTSDLRALLGRAERGRLL